MPNRPPTKGFYSSAVSRPGNRQHAWPPRTCFAPLLAVTPIENRASTKPPGIFSLQPGAHILYILSLRRSVTPHGGNMADKPAQLSPGEPSAGGPPTPPDPKQSAKP